MSSPIENLRNIGIIAHIDAGKTTTTERILYYTGASHRIGSVDDGTTVTDSDEEEAERGITIYSAAVRCRWNDIDINLIDTPGHVDFTAEVERSLRVLDGAVVVFSAVEGVEAQSETVWRQSDRYRVPRLCFINKMDRIGADFFRTFEEVKNRLGANPVALQIPVGAGSPPDPGAFSGVIDLLEMQLLQWDSESQGAAYTRSEIPADMLDEAKSWRAKLLEAVAMLDDDALTTYMETDDIPRAEIDRVLRVATIHGQIQPTFCGSALDHIGIQPILDAVAAYLPSPLDVPPIQGLHPNEKKRTGEPPVRKPSPSEPLAALIFKIIADEHTDFHFVRVYSGVLKAGTKLLNPRTGKKELVGQLWRIQADRRDKVETDSVEAGDIIGVIGLKEVQTGDTLCDAGRPILLESITFPETVISMAVEPESSADRKKLADTLAKLGKQDPTFRANISEETGQTIISGMGELHLEVLRHRMERDFKLNVKVHKPRVSYRETVTKAVTATGHFQRPTGADTHFAEVTLKMEPFQGEQPTEIKDNLKHGKLPADLQAALLDAVKNQIEGGGLLGYQLMNVRVTIVDVGYREGETNEIALRSATAHAYRECLSAAEDKQVIALLEPIMKIEVSTPEDFLGNIQADLNRRRAIITSSERRGPLCVIEAEAPLSQMFGYSNESRSLSQGRASYSMQPLKYAQAPSDVLQGML